MTRPTFFNGVVIAAVFGFFTSAVVATLTPFVGFSTTLRLVIPSLGLAYLLYLFSRSDERVGRITTLALWAVFAGITWWLGPPMTLYLLLHAGALWLVRSLYFYTGALPALLDLGLSALSISAAVWAITRSGSVFLATWCFFLVQALFVTIPPALRRRAARRQAQPQHFEHARRRADAALRQLFTQ